MQKTVLITGASSGFGLSACEQCLAKGWRVIAAVRGGQDRRPLFADLFNRYPEQLELLELDLSDRKSIDRLVEKLDSRTALDGLINNAGYGLFGSCEDMDEKSLRQQMEVNFFGAFALTQKLLPALRKSRGVVITVSSIVGRHALPLTGAYCASKFAVEGWMESLSAELKPYQVDCYLLEPGGYPTGFGNSLDWAEPGEGSVYAEATQGYQKLREKISARNKGKDISPVGKKMVYLLTKRPSGLRHLMGSDALSTAFFAKILPANLWHRILRSTMNSLQRRRSL